MNTNYSFYIIIKAEYGGTKRPRRTLLLIPSRTDPSERRR